MLVAYSTPRRHLMSIDRKPRPGGPLAAWGDDLNDWLAGCGCSPERSGRAVNAFWRFSAWMAARGLDTSALDEAVIDEHIRSEQERAGSRTVAAFQYLPLVKRYFAIRGVLVLRPVSRDLGGIPRLDAGPLNGVVADLVSWLRAEGYAHGTIASVACTAARLGAWLKHTGRKIEDLDDELLHRFVRSQARGPRRHPSSARRVVTVSKFLTAAGLLAAADDPESVAVTPVELCLQDLESWLVDERGDGQGWIRESRRWVGPFLEQMTGADGQVRWWDVDAGVVNTYVASEGTGYSLSARRHHLVSAMRTLLRWALVTGRVETDIRAGIFAPKRPPADVPRGLTAGQVAQILAAADRRTGKGLRDFALVLLLWRLGLRAGEAAGLALDDIDWHHGHLTVVGKGGRALRLPLPDDVGQALVDYLRGRPEDAGDRSVFLRSRPPIIGMSGKGVSSVVAVLARRAGLGTIHAHRLRHTTATAVLAGGGSLVEARELLGHARTDTTMTYARTDVDALRGLSVEWGRVA
jgi:site-specific recombinase XerD